VTLRSSLASFRSFLASLARLGKLHRLDRRRLDRVCPGSQEAPRGKDQAAGTAHPGTVREGPRYGGGRVQVAEEIKEGGVDEVPTGRFFCDCTDLSMLYDHFLRVLVLRTGFWSWSMQIGRPSKPTEKKSELFISFSSKQHIKLHSLPHPASMP